MAKTRKVSRKDQTEYVYMIWSGFEVPGIIGSAEVKLISTDYDLILNKAKELYGEVKSNLDAFVEIHIYNNKTGKFENTISMRKKLKGGVLKPRTAE